LQILLWFWIKLEQGKDLYPLEKNSKVK
jgi:hypothetical protein